MMSNKNNYFLFINKTIRMIHETKMVLYTDKFSLKYVHILFIKTLCENKHLQSYLETSSYMTLK